MNPNKGCKHLARLRLVLVFVIACVAIGYLSNWISKRRCESATARWLASSFQDAPQVFCVGWSNSVDPALLFPKNTVIMNNSQKKKRGDNIPVLVLNDAELVIPFVVRVNWTWYTSGLRGSLGVDWYACFLGLHVKIWQQHKGEI
jgi:hypothetical protein